jgi:hypothetical protein
MERYRVWIRLPETNAREWLEFLSENTPLLGEIVEAEQYQVRLTNHKPDAPRNYAGVVVGRIEREESS